MEASDEGSVTRLYERVFGADMAARWRTRFRWQFLDVPGSDLCPSLFWVAQLEGEIVGFLAAFPARYSLQGSPITFRYPCDLMVSESARGHRLGERLINTYLAAEPLLGNAFAYSPGAERIYERLGYQRVDCLQVMARPYRLRRAARLSVARRIAAVAADALMVLPRALRKVSLPQMGIVAHHADISELCNEVDALWQTCQRQIPMLAVRDDQFVRWRFQNDPLDKHEVFLARDSRGAITGYAITCVKQRRGLRAGHIIDMLVSRDSAPSVDALAMSAVAYLESCDVDIVIAQGFHPFIRRRLKRLLFLSLGRISSPARLLWKGAPELRDTVYDPLSWHTGYADADDFFSA